MGIYDDIGYRPDPGFHGEITLGPLADSSHDFQEKISRVLSGDNNFESPTEPGGNRMTQSGSSGTNGPIVQDRDSAGSSPSSIDTVKDSSPDHGSRGGRRMRKILARRSRNAKAAADLDESVDNQNYSRQPSPGNLPDNSEVSSWTGSGPGSALHGEEKTAAALSVDRNLITGILDVAGVSFDISESSSLFKTAADVAEMRKTASGLSVVSRDDVHPILLVSELHSALGGEWTSWEPETIRDSIIKEAGVEPDADVMAKIMAVKIVLARPERFYDDWQAFEKISMALNDMAPAIGTLEDVPVEWLSNSVTIVEKLAGEGDFGEDVKKYTAARLFDQGYVIPPPKLVFASSDLSGLVKNPALQKEVVAAYKTALDSSSPVQVDESDPVSIQVARLMRNHEYVLSKLGDQE